MKVVTTGKVFPDSDQKRWEEYLEDSEDQKSDEYIFKERSTYLQWITAKMSGRIHVTDIQRMKVEPPKRARLTVRALQDQTHLGWSGPIWTTWSDVPVPAIGVSAETLVGALSENYDVESLITETLAKANKADVDVLTALGEMPETIETIMGLLKAVTRPLASLRQAMRTGTVKELERAAKSIKRIGRGGKPNLPRVPKGREGSYGFTGHARDIGDAATQNWLLYRYGIMPIVYQIQDVLKALDSKAKEFHRFTESKSMGVELDFKEQVNMPTVRIPVIDPELTQHVKIKYDGVFRAWVKDQYSIEQLFYKTWGFNPLTTAWELTTLSFVVDWLVHVGDFITALETPCTSQRVVMLSFKGKANIDVDFTAERFLADKQYPRAIEISKNSRVVHTTSCYFRVKIGSPEEFLTIPTELQYNWKRKLDTVALLWPSIRKRLLK